MVAGHVYLVILNILFCLFMFYNNNNDNNNDIWVMLWWPLCRQLRRSKNPQKTSIIFRDYLSCHDTERIQIYEFATSVNCPDETTVVDEFKTPNMRNTPGGSEQANATLLPEKCWSNAEEEKCSRSEETFVFLLELPGTERWSFISYLNSICVGHRGGVMSSWYLANDKPYHSSSLKVMTNSLHQPPWHCAGHKAAGYETPKLCGRAVEHTPPLNGL